MPTERDPASQEWAGRPLLRRTTVATVAGEKRMGAAEATSPPARAAVTRSRERPTVAHRRPRGDNPRLAILAESPSRDVIAPSRRATGGSVRRRTSGIGDPVDESTVTQLTDRCTLLAMTRFATPHAFCGQTVANLSPTPSTQTWTTGFIQPSITGISQRPLAHWQTAHGDLNPHSSFVAGASGHRCRIARAGRFDVGATIRPFFVLHRADHRRIRNEHAGTLCERNRRA